MSAGNCRKCGGPIIFLSVRPSFNDPNPKSVPVDPIPNPAGSIAIYQYPNPRSVFPEHRDAKIRRNYFVYLHNAARDMYVQAGGKMFMSHFESCKKRN